MKRLSISGLRASVDGREIIHGITIAVQSGEVHAIMGPNGSGKSTLASVLMGHPAYAVKRGSSITVNGVELTGKSTDDRAKAGLFLAFQSPVAIPGVTVMNLLRTAYEQRQTGGKKPDRPGVQNPVLARRFTVGSMSIGEFTALVAANAKLLGLSEELLRRGIHEGFSGGEKKKIEMLQALVLPSAFAVFDEIDTGLDVDALRAVSKAIAELKKRGTGILVITHYQRILRYVRPDAVHVLVRGRLVDRGTHELARKIEKSGYGSYLQE